MYRKHAQTMTCENFNGTVSVCKMGKQDEYFIFYGAAAEFWSAIDGQSSFQEIQKRICGANRVSERSHKKMFDQFVAVLLKNKLVCAGLN